MTQSANNIVDEIKVEAERLGRLCSPGYAGGACAFEVGILRGVLVSVASRHPELAASLAEELGYIKKHIAVVENR